jgi:hypothetical protein
MTTGIDASGGGRGNTGAMDDGEEVSFAAEEDKEEKVVLNQK